MTSVPSFLKSIIHSYINNYYIPTGVSVLWNFDSFFNEVSSSASSSFSSSKMLRYKFPAIFTIRHWNTAARFRFCRFTCKWGAGSTTPTSAAASESVLPVYGNEFFPSSPIRNRRRTNRNSVPAVFTRRMFLFRRRSFLMIRNRMKICGVILIVKVIAALAISDFIVLRKLDQIIERTTVRIRRSSV